MILFDHIIQVFDLMDDDVGTVGLVIAGDGGFIGLTAVNGDDFGHPVTADRLRQKPQRRLGIPVLCQQNVTGRPGWIHGAIQIAPLAFDPDVRLVHAPADPHRPLALVERLFQWGTIRQDPAVDRRVVHGHAALRHQCFNMSITQVDIVNLLCAELLIRHEGVFLHRDRSPYAAAVPVTSCQISNHWAMTWQ
jgi:hypothetical protein